jgi:hypothetical protein
LDTSQIIIPSRRLRLEVRLVQVYIPALYNKQSKEKSNSPQTP